MNIHSLHDSAWVGVFYITGGGSMLLSNLLVTPGASATVLEGVIPYNFDSLCDLIHEQPDQACSAETARKMAMCAFMRAQVLSATSTNFGCAITASLGTNRPKRGQLRAHIAVQTSRKTHSYSVSIDHELTRVDQEQLLAKIGLEKLMSTLDLSSSNKYESKEQRQCADDEIQQLVLDGTSVVGVPGRSFLCGAFNPLHAGHRKMKEISEEILGHPVQYELCIRNIDKAPLDFIEIAKRRAQFHASELVITSQPTFIGKARLLAPNGRSNFIIGADTMDRLIDPSYYASAESCDAALAEFVRRGDEFIVFGRNFDGEFRTLRELHVDKSFLKICKGIPETRFHMDISSTQLRTEQRSHL